MKTAKTIILSTIIIIIASCHPDQFRLNPSNPDLNLISGLIIGKLDSVELIADNAIKLYEGGGVDLRAYQSGTTQLQADITAEILYGEEIMLAFRTVSDKFETRRAIKFYFSKDGCKLKQNDSLITSVDSIKAQIGEPSRIKLENYGDLINVTVDCDTLFYGRTNLPATEYVIARCPRGSRAKLSGIIFNDMMEE